MKEADLLPSILKAGELHDKAIDAVITDSCAFNVFNKPGMQAFIQFLKPDYQPPNRKTIAQRLRKKYVYIIYQ